MHHLFSSFLFFLHSTFSNLYLSLQNRTKLNQTEPKTNPNRPFKIQIPLPSSCSTLSKSFSSFHSTSRSLFVITSIIHPNITILERHRFVKVCISNFAG